MWRRAGNRAIGPWGPTVAVVGLGLLSACASPCADYPDRTSPLCAYETFVKAWRLGDLDVLGAAYGPSQAEVFQEGERLKGRDGLREWYRADVDRIAFGSPTAEEIGPQIAHVSVPMRDTRPGGSACILHFDFTRVGPEWKIFRIRRSAVVQRPG